MTRFAYAATVFLSAFLLFQVQPLLSKFILPWFGGTPAVWTSAMLFFQIVLFLGYLYAHLTSIYLPDRWRSYVHLSVLAVAAGSVALNRLVPPMFLRPTGGDNESPLLQVLLLLWATVGLPYFALSSTGPLLQKWFSETFGRSPYRLFALSNFGSLLALISYPFFFEANYGIITQTTMWSIAFIVFAGCCGYCAWTTYLSKPDDSLALGMEPNLGNSDSAGIASEMLDEAKPTAQQMFSWVALPTLACVLFLAVTNEVCQNIATVPLLWIVPLALYLLSFIVAFDQPKWYLRSAYALISLLLLLLLSDYETTSTWISNNLNAMLGLQGAQSIQIGKIWWVEAFIYFSALFSLLVVCHGELAKSKPSPRYLTWFYLTLSLGGALGGIFVNLIAPNIFKTFFELPLSVFFCSILCAGLLFDLIATKKTYFRLTLVGLGALLAIATCSLTALSKMVDRNSVHSQSVHQSRNFYGILSVYRMDRDTPEEHYMFISGSIKHGVQYADPIKRKIPLSYYGDKSGCQIAIKYIQERQEACHIGVIGLGVGTVAAYARPKDRVRFYEINPTVIEIAKNTQWFHYLSDCQGEVQTVLGDARLRLEGELREGKPQQFDVLVLDAFSGDAIPTHLLTDEAFALYSKHLKDDGILAVHITNTHLDLYPVVKQLAEKHQFGHRRMFADSTESLNKNYYVLLSKDAKFIEQTNDEISILPKFLQQPRTVPLWTDEYTNLTRLLR